MLVEKPGAHPRYFFVAVPEPKSGKNRVHLDFDADDPAAERDRLVALGATVLAELPDNWILADPEGNEFCLIRQW